MSEGSMKQRRQLTQRLTAMIPFGIFKLMVANSWAKKKYNGYLEQKEVWCKSLTLVVLPSAKLYDPLGGDSRATPLISLRSPGSVCRLQHRL